MRRIKPKPDFAINQRVEELWNRFEYPDVERPQQFDLGPGGGGAPTVVVAASDASDLSKSKADLICPGINDDQVIQGAIDQLPGFGVGGRVLLTEGTFNCNYGGIASDHNHAVTIQGLGQRSTRVVFDGGSGPGINMSFGPGMIHDLQLASDSGTDPAIQLHSSSGFRVDNVMFLNAGTGVEIAFGTSAALEVSITRCHFRNDGIGIDATPSSGGRGTVIVGNHFNNIGGDPIRIANTGPAVIGSNHINLFTGSGRNPINLTGGVQGLVVVGNIIHGSADNAIVATGSNNLDWVISGNEIEGLNGFAATTADIEGLTIADNAITATRSGVSIDGGTVVGHVTGNVIRSGRHSIWLNDCEQVTVAGNQIAGPGGGDNLYDGILISGTSPRNHIHGNTIYPSTTANKTRYGINIATTSECNIVVGNSLGDPDDYGTDALNDAGTDTQLTYPNDPTYGDNFTDCGSPSSP